MNCPRWYSLEEAESGQVCLAVATFLNYYLRWPPSGNGLHARLLRVKPNTRGSHISRHRETHLYATPEFKFYLGLMVKLQAVPENALCGHSLGAQLPCSFLPMGLHPRFSLTMNALLSSSVHIPIHLSLCSVIIVLMCPYARKSKPSPALPRTCWPTRRKVIETRNWHSTW